MSCLVLSLFGGFEARLGDISLTSFSTDKVRLLLAYLAVERSHPHRRESLAGLLWPGYPERSARTSLRHALANLRKVLDEAHNDPLFLLVDGEIIQLNPQTQVRLELEMGRRGESRGPNQFANTFTTFLRYILK